ALYTRATTGTVRAVEVALFEALGEWMGSPAYYTEYGENQPERVGAAHATIVPYGPFPTADGEVLLAVQNDREWVSLCTKVLGDPDLATDERFHSNSTRVEHRAECNEVIAQRTRLLSTAELLAQLDAAAIANGRLGSVSDFLDHPSLAGRDRWRQVDTPGGVVRALLPPATLSGIEPRFDPVPAHGAHTDAVLTELGYSPDAITALRTAATV
ncbi:CoA transferase, partial [Rhodococcus sp. DMU2021]